MTTARPHSPSSEIAKQKVRDFIKNSNTPKQLKFNMTEKKWVSAAADIALHFQEEEKPEEYMDWLKQAVILGKEEKVNIETIQINLSKCYQEGSDNAQALAIYDDIINGPLYSQKTFDHCCSHLKSMVTTEGNVKILIQAYITWINFLFDYMKINPTVDLSSLCNNLRDFLDKIKDPAAATVILSHLVNRAMTMPLISPYGYTALHDLLVTRKVDNIEAASVLRKCRENMVDTEDLTRTISLSDTAVKIMQANVDAALAETETKDDGAQQRKVKAAACLSQHYFSAFLRSLAITNGVFDRNTRATDYHRALLYHRTRNRLDKRSDFDKYFSPNGNFPLTDNELRQIYSATNLITVIAPIKKCEDMLKNSWFVNTKRNRNFNFFATFSDEFDSFIEIDQHHLHCYYIDAYSKLATMATDKTDYLDSVMKHFCQAATHLYAAKFFNPEVEHQFFYQSIKLFYKTHQTTIDQDPVLHSHYHNMLAICFPDDAVTHLKNAYERSLKSSVQLQHQQNYITNLIKLGDNKSLVEAMRTGSVEAGLTLLRMKSLPTFERCEVAREMLMIDPFNETLLEQFYKLATDLHTRLVTEKSDPFFKRFSHFVVRQVLPNRFENKIATRAILKELEDKEDLGQQSTLAYLSIPPNQDVLEANIAKGNVHAVVYLARVLKEASALQKTSLYTMMLFLLSDTQLVKQSDLDPKTITQLNEEALAYLTKQTAWSLGDKRRAYKIAIWAKSQLINIPNKTLKLADLAPGKSEPINFFLTAIREFNWKFHAVVELKSHPVHAAWASPFLPDVGTNAEPAAPPACAIVWATPVSEPGELTPASSSRIGLFKPPVDVTESHPQTLFHLHRRMRECHGS